MVDTSAMREMTIAVTAKVSEELRPIVCKVILRETKVDDSEGGVVFSMLEGKEVVRLTAKQATNSALHEAEGAASWTNENETKIKQMRNESSHLRKWRRTIKKSL